MEESFPRGGSLKKSEETTTKKRPREDENLFSTHHEEEEESIKKKKKKELKEKAKATQHAKTFAPKLKAVELPKFKDLSVGMLFLGCVKEAKDFELAVCLPYGLTGYVQATNICEAYTKMLNEQVEKDVPLEGLMPLSSLYSPGMLVRCSVCNLEMTSGGFNSIKLSLNPKHINGELAPSSLHAGMSLSGLVSSIEDHGYLIDLGIGGTKGFLPNRKAQLHANQSSKGLPLIVGQYLNCVIEEVKNNGRIVHLSILQSDVASAIATEEQKWTLNNLLPGLVVKGQIQKVADDHVALSFLSSSYTGIVDFLHFEPTKAHSYQKDQTVKACIVWIDRTSKTIRLTFRKSFLQPWNPVKQLSSDWIGSVHENCKVKALHKSVGALFELDEGTAGFAFKYNLISGEPSDVSKFKEETVHTGRVMAFSPMDETLFLSFKEKVIEAPYLRYEDIQAGQIVEGTVKGIETEGVVVTVTKQINGLIPNLHLADITLQQPEKIYTPGAKIKCRVLNVFPSARKLILTRKKTMINSKLPIIGSFHDAEPGMITHGFIWVVKDYGCIVKFYNDVHGLAPVRELSSQFIPSPQEAFYKGQVVKVKVLECNTGKESLLLSFNIFEDENEETQKGKPRKKTLQETGKIVDVKIVSKTDTELDALILPQEKPAVLPKFHLSDHVTNCELLFRSLEEGDVLTGAMCLNSFKGKTILTRKPAFISSMEKESYAKHFSEVQVGMLLTGYIKNIMPYGVFVEFLYGLVGLAPKSDLSDKFVTQISDHFAVGQTVVAKVTNIDEQKKRFLVTLKMSECAPDNCAAESVARISQCFSELHFSKDLMKRNEDQEEENSILSLVPGRKLNLVVEEVKEDGSVLFSRGKISGVKRISTTQQGDAEKPLVPGQKPKAVVVHVDILNSHVYVSVNATLLKKCNKTFAENSTHSAVVQYIAEEFVVVSLEGTSQLAAVPLCRHYNDTFRFDSEKLKLGQTILVKLSSVNADEYGLLLAVQAGSSARDKSTVAPFLAKQKPSIGAVVTGTVKCIKPTSVVVSLTEDMLGTIHASQITEDVPVGSLPTARLWPNQSVTCRVIGGREVKTHRFLPITHPNLLQSVLELTILPSLIDPDARLPKHKILKLYSPGEKVTCFVSKYNKITKCLEVEIVPVIRGQIEQLLISNTSKVVKRPDKHFKLGQALSATMVGLDSIHRVLLLSLTDITALTEGCITVGCVESVNPSSGLEISLPFGKTGKANLFQLHDQYEEVSMEKFSIGMFVRCCILSVGNKVSISLRESRTNPHNARKVIDEDISSIDSLQEGQLVKGFVSAVTDKGVFFRVSSCLNGHIMFKNVTSYYVKDIEQYKLYIPEGKLLTAKIISIDKQENRMELSILSKDTGNPDVIPESAGFSMRWNPQEKKRTRTDSESESKGTKKRRKSCESKEDEDSGVEVHCQETETENEEKKKTVSSKASVPRLQVSSAFSWDVSLNTLKTSVIDGKESSSDSEEEAETPQPTAKKTQKALAAEKKSRKETADGSRHPQSINEIERLVLGSPNSSTNWIQYMEFHLQATELEQARAVAERALQTIYFREEQEKLNVWVAMLNMENTYGTEETLLKTFERACQYNDPLKAFHHLVDIYIKSEKFKEADALFSTMVKRFRQEKSVYCKYATFMFKQGQSEAAHRLLQRALKCLPEKEHVDLISKFAQIEFRLGDPVRAKALFESTLSSYPKRTDIWSVYIDMMMKHGNQKEIREIFERVIHLSLAAKRIKFFFKRYLDYEKKYGNEKTVQAVKEKALQYVESKSSMSS
ncbi:protein RRP5 homolog isoform X2 [Hyperolius riggenbachi]|uniref:protein RRP5 homolog isoform X2 n=1 Tax=Hyperolius riggenbachi TaxID=752182 RepID=UPI0035A318BC